MFDRDTNPIIAPKETKGTGMHVNNAYYDNPDDDKAPLDGDLDGREIKLSDIYPTPESINVDDRVVYGEQGLGTVIDVWEDVETGKTKFKVFFDIGRHTRTFYFPDVFDLGLMIMY